MFPRQIRHHFALILFFCFTTFTSGIFAQAPAGQPPAAKAAKPLPPVTAPSNNTYPQIVRIRYLDGDVRVARGEAIEKKSDTVWEQAATGLPLETGFNLATGTGRAEIEFEDASTIYLDSNSALSLDDLHTTAGIPYTEVTLLTGTLTVHVHPAFAGESFVVKTPTDSISIAYPEKAYLRIDAYLDAIAVTPQKDESFQVTGAAAQKGATGQTVYYNNGQPVIPGKTASSADLAEWDRWVATRVAHRSAALASVTAASGLPASTPGLADMNGQGAFFKCAPYGICWEPPADGTALPSDQPAPQPNPPTPVPVAEQGPDFYFFLAPDAVSVNPGDKTTVKISAASILGFAATVDVAATLPAGITCVTPCGAQFAPGQTVTMQFAVAPSAAPGTYSVPINATSGSLTHQTVFTIYVLPPAEADALPFTPEVPAFFPCFPEGLRPLTIHDNIHGRVIALRYWYGTGTVPYAWAVCNTGSWIYRGNMYVWVVPHGTERRRHHHHPIHWVKEKKTTGYVPFHPRDVAGQPPVNRKHEIYGLGDKNGSSIERTTFDPGGKIEAMKDPPKEFRKPEPLPLTKADAPTIRAYEINDALFGGKGAGSYLTFDRQAQSFLISREIANGVKSTAITQPFQAHRSGLFSRNNTVTPRGGTHIGGTHIGGTHAGGAAHTGGTHTGGTHTGGTHAGGGHAGGGGGHAGGGGGHAGGGGGHAGGGHR